MQTSIPITRGAEQAKAIARYYRHLCRNGAAVTAETAGRAWIARYAAMWRQHANGR